MQIKLLSFQPGSLYENGGAGRLLRRLYEGHEENVTTLYVTSSATPSRKGPIKEISVSAFPLQRPWMRWHLRTFATYIRDTFFTKSRANKIIQIASTVDCDVIHVINHGRYSAALCNSGFSDKPLWVSFHDHFTTCSTFEDANQLWQLADRRLIISEELGVEYQKLFGLKDFELITDGVLPAEISVPKQEIQSTVCVYFAGLLHIDYLPLFRVLADALDVLSKDGLAFKLVLRGTQVVDFLENRSFTVEYRQDFVTDESIKRELDEADILYLPIKFTVKEFYLYSLSTKMVGYLGASGSILYHGPKDSAACNLLSKYGASENCGSYDPIEMIERIKSLLSQRDTISAKAKELATTRFNLEKIRAQFWNLHS